MRRARTAVLLSLASLVSMGWPLSASGEGSMDPRAVVEHIFEVADKDRNGRLSRTEYASAGLERYGVSFDQCDANRDGATSLIEYLAIYDRYHPPADQVSL